MKTESELRQLATEARAQILRGESPDKTREWLFGQNVSNAKIDRIVSSSMSERALEIRKRGISELLLGTLIFAVAVVTIAAMYFSGTPANQYSAKLVIVFALVGVYGFYRLAKGLLWLIASSKNNESLTQT